MLGWGGGGGLLCCVAIYSLDFRIKRVLDEHSFSLFESKCFYYYYSQK